MRLIALMGSGETSPTMVSVHRELVDRLGPGPCSAVLVETPYGFQENVADISARAQAYFARSVGLGVEVPPGLRDGASGPDADLGLAAIRSASWVFAGPGSPSYALEHWRGKPIGAALRDHARTGRAAIVFASAAACTLGRYAIPVYEIYKAGYPPRWLEGLDALSCLGLKVAVIPHYDNTEGGTHDTRYCYLGERRLRLLERELADDAAVLGLDEHTAAVIDVGLGTVSVSGRGVLTVRRAGDSVEIPAGQTITMDELRALVKGVRARPRAAAPAPRAPEPVASLSLREIVLAGEARFSTAEGERDAAAMVRAILDIETAITEWAADTEEDEGTGWAADVMRSLIVRLGEHAARGLADPREALAPAVEPLLAVRGGLRERDLYSLADSVRDALVAAGIEIHDTPEGTTWNPAR